MLTSRRVLTTAKTAATSQGVLTFTRDTWALQRVPCRVGPVFKRLCAVGAQVWWAGRQEEGLHGARLPCPATGAAQGGRRLRSGNRAGVSCPHGERIDSALRALRAAAVRYARAAALLPLDAQSTSALFNFPHVGLCSLALLSQAAPLPAL